VNAEVEECQDFGRSEMKIGGMKNDRKSMGKESGRISESL